MHENQDVNIVSSNISISSGKLNDGIETLLYRLPARLDITRYRLSDN
jgi:hypothetical protein